MKLDVIDKKILMLLQKDSKITNKELSLSLNLSVTAIYERIKKMERSGVIAHYVALVDKQKVELDFQVFCHVKLAHHGKEAISSFEKDVIKLDEVLECFHVSGDYDYLLKVVVKDMEHYRSFMVTKLTALKFIGSTQSSFTISEVKNTLMVKV
ncbi:Lrp/AsnC family transcriptional regulator [Dokdonia sp. Hel_I_53]|uniref:Lrp/AsnC family transcriptional regulator n=1 Tax=Dokdonia sp. Hel_I_53 TaxID=1566287 RepID=UPI00119BD0EE|nr:Lrp/AsnC family transcriptional regulator [Dokdonia sp. Hel_I_53]TVZ50952.1 AsnC family transcriptional regulator [Dokdonia sp. Hel_I_53]